MEQARMARANNPDADKVLAGKPAQRRDRAEDAAAVARVKDKDKVAAVVAARVRVAAVRDAVRIVNTVRTDGLLIATNQGNVFGNDQPLPKTKTRRVSSCQDLTEADPWGPAP